ncbi:MAG: hypothetical protein O6945_16175 [Gammaproteobacteria bacterium]|nr:hypothetical protein [Gammaproteobacteria bacterium]
MKVKIFRQRVSQVHESEVEINDWLQEVEGKVNVQFVEQASYFTDNSENGQPGFIISVWYTDSA